MKKLAFSTIYIICVSLFISCATEVKMNYKPNYPNYKVKKEKTYQLNEINKVNVGEDMIILFASSKKSTSVYKAIKYYQPPKFDLTVTPCPIEKDTYFYIYGYSDQGIIIQSAKQKIKSSLSNEEATEINDSGKVLRGTVYLAGGHVMLAPQDEWTEKDLFIKDSVIEHITSDYLYKLIYNGKSGNTIKIAYREFVDNKARPAFDKDLEYNLDESKTISFKTITIEIIQATNSFIEFKVIEDKDLPWVE